MPKYPVSNLEIWETKHPINLPSRPFLQGRAEFDTFFQCSVFVKQNDHCKSMHSIFEEC